MYNICNTATTPNFAFHLYCGLGEAAGLMVIKKSHHNPVCTIKTTQGIENGNAKPTP